MLVSIVHRRIVGRDGKPMEHQQNWGSALAEGLRKHGVDTEIIEWNRQPHRGDLIACWGWLIGKGFVASGKRTLVCERGYAGDRKEWISAGWDGLNGRASRPLMNDGGERWRLLFGGLEKPWRYYAGLAVILGQVEGDQAVANVNLRLWYREAAAAMRDRGFNVAFRPHPDTPQVTVAGVQTLGGTLAEVLDRAAVAVSWNSNSGVDAALAGVPVIACDRGSMAWPIATHGLAGVISRPERSDWLAQLAWSQFSKMELASGMAWDFLRHGLD